MQFIEQASEDPQVLAIKMTLYRTAEANPIITALARAAENGKQVTALVELQARLDEENNIDKARMLQKAGVHVVYGIVGLKTHCKASLVVRRDHDGIRRYVHLATGNYNPTTARYYTDLSFFTCRPEFGEDASALFNLLTGYSQVNDWNKLIVAPAHLSSRLSALIERECAHAEAGSPARIIAKMNSLVDPADHRHALPGLAGGGEDRPDHPRHLLPAAGNAGHLRQHPGHQHRRQIPRALADLVLPERRRAGSLPRPRPTGCRATSAAASRSCSRSKIPSSSGGWSTASSGVVLADNVKARELQPDGTYRRVAPARPGEPSIRSQLEFQNMALELCETSPISHAGAASGTVAAEPCGWLQSNDPTSPRRHCHPSSCHRQPQPRGGAIQATSYRSLDGRRPRQGGDSPFLQVADRWLGRSQNQQRDQVAQGRVVADDHQPVLGPLAQPALDRRGRRAGLEHVRDLQKLSGIKHVGHDLGRRAGPGQRAGDDPVELQVQLRRPRAICRIRFSPLGVKRPLVVRRCPAFRARRRSHAAGCKDRVIRLVSRAPGLIEYARLCFQLAASSPSMRSVRHLALPPDLMNSENPSGRTPKPRSLRVLGQLGRPVVQDHGLADDHRVAAKRDGFLGRDLDQMGDPVAQHRAAIVVERAGIVEGKVGRQRAEAGIEMIEPRVDQLQGQGPPRPAARRSTGGSRTSLRNR